MRKNYFLLISLFIWFLIPLKMQGQTYDQLWKRVEEAQKKSLPKTTINLTSQIFKKAQEEKNSPQMLKAYTARSMYNQQITPDSFYVDLKGLEQWVKTSTDGMERAVLHTLIAGIYADYYNNNQWQLRQRTDLTGDSPEDIREWSGNLFFTKVVDHSYAALEDSTLLVATSSKDYRPFVVLGNASEYYRHDMYHMLALKAVNSIKTVSGYQDRDKGTPIMNTIFDRLINTYTQLNNKDAVILVTLDKLLWEYQTQEQGFIPMLDQLIEQYGDREVATEIYIAKINQLLGKNEQLKALQTADEAIARYPKYDRINAVKSLRESILTPDMSVSMDAKLYPGAEYQLRVNHRNISGFTVEYYLLNLPVTSPLLNNYYPDFKKLQKYARKVNSQRLQLLKPSDYVQKDTVFNLTAPTEGLYLIRVIPDNNVERSTSRLASVSRFKFLTYQMPDDLFEVVVLDGMSGHPVQDARVRLFSYNKGDKFEAEVLTTNASGRATTPFVANKYQFLTIEKGTDKGMQLQNIGGGYYRPSNSARRDQGNVRVALLTDRSIYRPGQTIYVKGIAYNLKSDTADVVAGKQYTLYLRDSNGREINKQELKTNEFGSFATEIVLPVGGLNGYYQLQTEAGSTMIRVEEYKRPTFDITFDPLEGAYRLGDNIQVKGTVKSFSGVYVQDVPVNYTVRRYWRGWWGRYYGGNVLIDSGTTQLGDNGNFSIPVSLQPDETRQAVERSADGYYEYIIEASVTNIAGETQSSTTTLGAGTRSLLLEIDINERVNRDDTIKVTFNATNLSSQPIDVKGTYKVFPFTNYKEKKIATNPVLTGTFVSNKETVMEELNSLASGRYKIVITANDAQGREATSENEVILFSVANTRPPAESNTWLYPINTKFDEYNPASFIFGTSHKDAYILMDVFTADKRVESKTFNISDSLTRFDYPYKEEYGDGVMISFYFVKNGQIYSEQVRLEKRIPDKQLKMKWEVFRDKLRPGQQEEWRLTITNPQGLPADAEMLATLYDASLDKIWNSKQSLLLNYSRNIPYKSWEGETIGSNYFDFGFPVKEWKYRQLVYDDFWTSGVAYAIRGLASGVSTRSGIPGSARSVMMKNNKPMVSVEQMGERVEVESEMVLDEVVEVQFESGGGDVLPPPPADLRTNFAETAFFYPQLRTNEKGEIVISFTIPESLTRWNFRGYAHTKGMLTGMLNGEVVTSKEFMLTPNLPRFVRVGDKTSVAASVTNTTGNDLSGTVTFTLFDPITDKVISVQKEKFAAAAGKSSAVNFSFAATDKYDMLGCRIVADGGTFSDGEQHLLPVLSNKERIIETVSMPVRGNETREFSLGSLFNNNSKTATDRSLTVEFSGNPAWYAVQALPSVSMPDNDNAISWATAYYANSLSAYIMNAQPRIKTMMETWKAQGGTKDTFISNLQKNQDVKNILLEESPWLMEATSEADQMRRIATLFDLNNVSNNNITAINKLKELQLNDGSWSWYKGMSGSRYITTYIVETMVRLNTLTGNSPDQDMRSMQSSAFGFLHSEALSEYKRIREAEKKGSKVTGVSGSILEYLYLVAIAGEQIPPSNKEAQSYYLAKISETLATQSVKEKSMSAIILSKAGQTAQANNFMASLKEYLVQTDEQGMHFAFNESPYRWNDLRIPAHVAAMEAFDVVAKDANTVEEMKIWLLKQKQTQQWDSPVSTVNAVYALLHRGSNLLESRGDVRISIGNKVLETLSPAQETIPGMNYIKQTFTDRNMVNKPGNVKVEKRDSGIAWGAVYAQYNEEIDKVNRHAGELGVDKKLYVERVQGSSKELVPVTSGTVLAVGDKVVSRVTITLDRAMDFVQLKDQRGACFEPIGALSGYSYSNGFGYYVAVKDASTNFFFDSLGKGVYVLEYSYRVSRTGTYEAGLATIQSAYAPEYASHSASMKLTVEN